MGQLRGRRRLHSGARDAHAEARCLRFFAVDNEMCIRKLYDAIRWPARVPDSDALPGGALWTRVHTSTGGRRTRVQVRFNGAILVDVVLGRHDLLDERRRLHLGRVSLATGRRIVPGAEPL